MQVSRKLSMLLALLAAASGGAQVATPIPAAEPPLPTAVMLYPKGAPGALGRSQADQPRLYPFVPPQRSTGASVLVIPGGGYSMVALGHEGFQYARWLNAQGITAFVLDYRVAPYSYPAPIADGATAMRYIRAHATEMNLDPDRVGIWGSSAGGHLAATLGTQCRLGDGPSDPVSELDCTPNFLILSYPVISMEPPVTHPGSRQLLLGANPDPGLAHKLGAQNSVTATTPPTFLWATTGDPVVPVANSVLFYTALQAAKVPVEMHLFDYADHGCGLCGTIPQLAGWPNLLRTWLVARRLLPAEAPPPPPPGPNMPDWPAGLDGPGHKE